MQTEKLLVIEQVLRINNQAVLDSLLQWLLAAREDLGVDIPPLPPQTDTVLAGRMQQSIKEAQADDTVSHDEVLQLMQKWRRPA